jgi:hypothetical protein
LAAPESEVARLKARERTVRDRKVAPGREQARGRKVKGRRASVSAGREVGIFSQAGLQPQG